ncbi:MAG: DNA alkylation repair protein [Pseudomonadota bacterium]
MNAEQVLRQLEPLGTAGYRKTLSNHGIPQPLFGVKIADMKRLLKEWRIKKDYQLALDLYDTGNYDARYLAGLIADERHMSRDELRKWADTANCSALRQCAVAWVSAESAHGHALALQWIDSGQAALASTGWATLGGLVALRPDSELNTVELRGLLLRVQQQIHEQPDDVRYTMNNFVIAVGSYVAELTDLAIETGAQIGRVSVDMGDTACQMPFAPDYIRKVQARGSIGKKRKTVRC